ncbi:MAG: single-stranded DNA-binding protein [Candidatus Gracilibacteria bacterium]|nr:single-stranded DNA-binding protein [Candidatus Gracilibacteria bacterium]
MNSLNKVQLIGNLTAAPEVKETPNGQKVANFSVATNRVWKDASGMKQEQVEFHNIVIWGSLAGIAEQYLTKGKKVYLEGRLQTRSWDDPTGAKRYKTEVVADNLIMLSGGRDEGSDSFSQEAPEEVTPAKTRKAAPKAEEEINIEDIPF